MAEKKSRWSKLFSVDRSRSQSLKETSSPKKGLFSTRSRGPPPEPAQDKGKVVDAATNRAEDEPRSTEPKAEKSNEKGAQVAGDYPNTNDKNHADQSAADDPSALLPTAPSDPKREDPAASLPDTAERKHFI
jgi:hypothetical protein